MRKRLSALFLSSLLVVASVASADDKAPKKGGDSSLRRDPKGVKGISPFWEALSKGDSAFVARDFEGAVTAYRDAITKEPQNALGHYRIGEAQIAKGDLHEAEEAFVAGLRFVGNNAVLKAKLQFAIADLRERQKSYDDASLKWTEYETFTTEQASARGFPASATERKRVVENWKKLSADAADVKARIEKRLKEVDEAVRKSSK